MSTELQVFILFICAFVISVCGMPLVIPLLRKLKFGQTVRNVGPETHLVKNGTPTMGGIVFVVGFMLTILVSIFNHTEFIPVTLMTVLFGLVGFIDDFIKVKKKQSEGLKAWQKMGLQIVFTGAVLAYMYFATDISMNIIIPFTNGFEINLGIFVILFDFLVILGTDTGANFTDGLDGLCTKVSLVILVFMFFVAIKQESSLILPIAAFAGSLLAFLVFNAYPAKVFMGDTGALAIGGFISICAIQLRIPLFLIIIAFIYVAEVGSVMMQVSYFKLTHGKRIFKMTPIHHHFEKCGWKETKVVNVFTIVTIILCSIAYLGV